MPRRIQALFFGFAFLCAIRAEASVVVVPDDFPTIRQAIDSSADTIWVRPGDYPERIQIVLGDPTTRSIILIATYPGTGVEERPRIASFSLGGDYDAESVTLDGLHLIGPANISGPEKSKQRITIVSCAFDSGLTLTGTYSTVRGSTIRGDVWFYYSEGGFTADTLFGGRILAQGQGTCGVGKCLFEGPGSVGLQMDAVDMSFGMNESVVRGYDRGISGAAPDQSVWIADNQFEDCGTAIALDRAGYCYVLRNDVRRCGTGISVAPDGDFTVLDNRMTGCTGDGLVAHLRDGQGDLWRNIAGSCGGDGIVLRQDGSTKAVLVSNTTYGNGGSGISLQRTPDCVSLVSNNIGFANGGYGVRIDSADEVLTLACNDWFGNVLGAVDGTTAGASDLSVDPGFCDIAIDDVSLRADSPLLNTTCGLIGALGQGCSDAPTPTLVTSFTVERVAEGVRLRWQFSRSLPSSELQIERAEQVDGPWAVLAPERLSEGVSGSILDRDAVPGRGYWYRLREDETVLAGPLPVTAVGDQFSLVAVHPNPGRGPIAIDFTVPRRANLSIDLVDLQGRCLRLLVSGVQPAGRHRVEWSGLMTSGAPAPSGIYFARYRYPGGQQVQRLVRVR